MGGCINEFTSRRVNFDVCQYWSRDDSRAIDLEEYAYHNAPDGIFYAKEVSAFDKSFNEVAGLFAFDQNTITIETSDMVDIKNGDRVYFDDEYWHCVNVQYREIHKSKQFLKMDLKTTYIQLRR